MENAVSVILLQVVIVGVHLHILRQAGGKCIGANACKIQGLGGFVVIVVDAQGGLLVGGQLQLKIRQGFHRIRRLGIKRQGGILGGRLRGIGSGFLITGAQAEDQRQAQKQGK